MNRRSFISLLGAATVCPLSLLKAKPGYTVGCDIARGPSRKAVRMTHHTPRGESRTVVIYDEFAAKPAIAYKDIVLKYKDKL